MAGAAQLQAGVACRGCDDVSGGGSGDQQGGSCAAFPVPGPREHHTPRDSEFPHARPFANPCLVDMGSLQPVQAAPRVAEVLSYMRSPTSLAVLCMTRRPSQMWAILDVHFVADQAPKIMSVHETLAAGYASCTGLSILLVAACRSLGVPAR